MNLIGSRNRATAPSAIVDFGRFDQSEIFFCVKRPLLPGNGDDPKTLAFIEKGLIRKIDVSVGLAIYELLERRIINVICSRNSTRIAMAHIQIFDADKDVSVPEPPRVSKSQNVL